MDVSAALHQFRSIPLNPPIDRGVIEVQTPLPHHFPLNCQNGSSTAASIAPRAFSEAFCASVIPFTPRIFIRSYGLSLRKVCRLVPVWVSQTIMVPSSSPLASRLPSKLKATDHTLPPSRESREKVLNVGVLLVSSKCQSVTL